MYQCQKKKQYVSVLFYIFLFLNSGVGHLHYWINYYLIKKSTNAFSKDMLHSVVYICVEEDSYCSSIMIPNKPQSFTRTIWRSKRTKESWLSCTFLRSHLTSDPLNIYEATWNVRKPSIPLLYKLSSWILYPALCFAQTFESLWPWLHWVIKRRT